MAEYGEDSFDDADLDTLPHDALLELENNAIQFTQAQTQAHAKAPPASSDYGDEFDDEDLDDAVVVDEARSTPAIPAFQRKIPGPATQQEQFRQQRYGAPTGTQIASRHRQVDISRLQQPVRHQHTVPTPQNESLVAEQGSHPSTAVEVNVDSLERQIEELIREKNELRNQLNAKTGEIAIVRSKQDKTIKEYEREMVTVKKLNEDKLAKQQKALEAALISEQNAATEREFIRRDLAEETERVRRLNRERETEKKNDNANLLLTPKKKVHLHRDGFDDNEIEVVSPSKMSPSRFQRRAPISPAKPGKRKRKPVDSPAGVLEVIQPDEPMVESSKPAQIDEALIAKLVIKDDRFDFLGTMLDHRIDADHLLTLEELGKYKLPSSPNESFQSKILSKIPEMGVRKPSKDLPIDFCELLISMWQSCLKEDYLSPIHHLINLLTHALELKTTLVAPRITDNLIPVAQDTAEKVAIPRYRNIQTSDILCAKDIDVSACLSLLHLVALGCMAADAHITRFWQYMRWDFVIIMLSTEQPREDHRTMLALLSTSVRRETFGPILLGDMPEQKTGYIIDRLMYPIVEVPFRPGTEEKVDLLDLAQTRIEIIELLIGMTRSPYSSRALANHPNVFGQMVCLMSDELDVLYDYKTGHELSARIVSLTARFLNHLVTQHDKTIDMQRKLSVIHGGNQKYLLCLSRLNFMEEDLVLEAGIDPDVASCALELLEAFVTPEEGDAIQSAFSAS